MSEPLSAIWLADVLRHPDKWPPGFVWDYVRCETCAIGMMGQLLGLKGLATSVPTIDQLVEVLGISHRDADRIFTRLHFEHPGGEKVGPLDTREPVTPEEVAEELESLANRLP